MQVLCSWQEPLDYDVFNQIHAIDPTLDPSDVSFNIGDIRIMVIVSGGRVVSYFVLSESLMVIRYFGVVADKRSAAGFYARMLFRKLGEFRDVIYIRLIENSAAKFIRFFCEPSCATNNTFMKNLRIDACNGRRGVTRVRTGGRTIRFHGGKS